MSTTSLPAVLTLADAKRAAAEVVAEMGEDHIYERHPFGDPEAGEDRCQYVGTDSRTASSLASSRALNLTTVAALERVEGQSARGLFMTPSFLRPFSLDLRADPRAIDYLDCLQIWQDEGTPTASASPSRTTSADRRSDV